MVERELPEELIWALRGAQGLVALAEGLHQRSRAVAASGSILLAAQLTGWHQSEMAALLGLKRQTVQKRVETARARYGNTAPALVFDAPLGRPPAPLAVLRLPVTDRAWLTPSEAAQHVGQHRATIRNWRLRGLLPNTVPVASSVSFLYLRADLDRVQSGPRRGVYPDYRRLIELIATAPL